MTAWNPITKDEHCAVAASEHEPACCAAGGKEGKAGVALRVGMQAQDAGSGHVNQPLGLKLPQHTCTPDKCCCQVPFDSDTLLLLVKQVNCMLCQAVQAMPHMQACCISETMTLRSNTLVPCIFGSIWTRDTIGLLPLAALQIQLVAASASSRCQHLGGRGCSSL